MNSDQAQACFYKSEHLLQAQMIYLKCAVEIDSFPEACSTPEMFCLCSGNPLSCLWWSTRAWLSPFPHPSLPLYLSMLLFLSSGLFSAPPPRSSLSPPSPFSLPSSIYFSPLRRAESTWVMEMDVGVQNLTSPLAQALMHSTPPHKGAVKR